ncbi:zf-HC2 domain-containing protein [Paenibacillus tarimensis]|uniref:zf-HC2 domain-containing protein n=1 Tax=Paenibacillus tarimensis TaxID=416012 RepID=UPI001F490A51|nr:zf-HC2 domain-containing protein [Paenibacillus tarimensis]MCF2942023.1 zf-HC2 domain-containing protein [Paenibacillus tarimensis]
MTCQEVMELMQRQLDEDLDERETADLTEHIRHCPECEAMMERLNRLSGELANLPKVQPKYSLVDTILPQLEQIDQMREENMLLSQASDDLEIEQAAALASSTSGRSRVERRSSSWFERRSIRWLSGVTAAGLVIGLFLFTYEPQRFGQGTQSFVLESRTGGSDSGAGDEAADFVEPYSMQDQMGGADAGSTADNQADSGNETSSDAREERSALQSGADEDHSSPASPAESGESSEGSRPAARQDIGGNSGSVVKRPPAAESNSSPGNAADRDPSGRAKQPAAVSPPSSSDQPGTDSGENESASALNNGSSAEANGSSTSADNGNMAEDNTVEEEGIYSAAVPENDENTGSYGNMGIAAESSSSAEPEQERVSPNAVYRAAVTDRKLIIVEETAGGTVFEGRTKNGEISITGWTADSTSVEYEVLTKDGTVERYRVDINLGTETKI